MSPLIIGLKLEATLFGILSATGWGAGDFCGGMATKRGHASGVVIVSQLVGALLLIGLALALTEPFPSGLALLLGGLAGIFGTFGLLALYQGLAQGYMGRVAPLAALVSAAVPVSFGAFVEGLPSPAQLAGFALALGAVWLIARTGDGARASLQDMALPVLAGLGFGLFLILIDQASDSGVLWPLVAARGASLLLLTGVSLLSGRRPYPARKQLPLSIVAGILDTGGNTFYALAAQVGRLDVAAVLSSLYPAATVLLAWIILKERLSGWQWVGVGAALAALALVSSKG